MVHLRLLIIATFVLCGSMQTAQAFSRKVIQNDGSYDEPTSSNGGSSSRTYDTFTAPAGGSCKVSCNSSSGAIQVDIRSRCMCISGSKCFLIDIGSGRAGSETTNGIGIMSANVSGVRYRSEPGGGTTSYSRDAINMGIGANTRFGKWIHKTQRCGPGGGRDTAGCVGVPCQYWPEVKRAALAGKSVQICNGVNYPSSKSCGGRCGSSSSGSQSKGSGRSGTN